MKKILFVLSIGILLSSCGSGGCPCEVGDDFWVMTQREMGMGEEEGVEFCCKTWEYLEKQNNADMEKEISSEKVEAISQAEPAPYNNMVFVDSADMEVNLPIINLDFVPEVIKENPELLKAYAENYSGYFGGNSAVYYELGMAYLNNGEYQEAITALEQVAFEDEMIASITFGAIGDAYIELGNITSAAEYYEKAYISSNNDLTAPKYMLKAAYTKETANKFDDAIKIYEDLIKDYPLVPEADKAKKYIELAK